MNLNWEDGYTKEYELGAKIRGVKHNLLRPSTLTISRDELLDIIFGTELQKSWVSQVLIPALRNSHV